MALFPYREELDQSGALLRALGAGVPVAAYDVGGIAEPVTRFAAGVVAPPDDVDALTDGVRRLLGDRAALEAARAGARRAAAELTWEKAAAAHVALYEELAMIRRRRRPRFAELVDRQLDFFDEDHAGLVRRLGSRPRRVHIIAAR